MAKTITDEGKLYDFCFDWQMGAIPFATLCKEFEENGWQFSVFKEAASVRGWWVNSMHELINIQKG